MSGLQPLEHPASLPLSQISEAIRILSPHIPLQVEAFPTWPEQVYPLSKAEHFEQPNLLPLSHASVDALIPSPQTGVQAESSPNLFLQ
jgi:hypothetical protein